MGTASGDVDLSSCFLFFDNDSGKAVSLVSSATGVLTPTTLIDGGLSLEINTYPYAFLILDNALEMQHTETFDSTMTGSSSTGTSCWTLKKTKTNSKNIVTKEIKKMPFIVLTPKGEVLDLEPLQ